MTEARIYHAQADCDGKFWRVFVPAIDRTTQARSLAEIEPMARDLIALMDDVPAESFALRVAITYPASEDAHQSQPPGVCMSRNCSC